VFIKSTVLSAIVCGGANPSRTTVILVSIRINGIRREETAACIVEEVRLQAAIFEQVSRTAVKL
jgi:hypothetical protein